MIFIVLEGTPIPKARARIVKRHGMIGSFTPKKSADYSDALAWAAQIEMKGKKMLEGALCVLVSCYMPIPKSLKKKLKRESRTPRSLI